MKFKKLFQKIEDYFGMNDEDAQKREKTEKLLSDLEIKIESLKAKIKTAVSKSKKTKLKKQVSALKELREKLLKEEI